MLEKIMPVILGLSIKDWLIFVTLTILAICLLEIRKLKKLIILETQRQLVPQLALEIKLDASALESGGFYLKNDSFFLARDIEVEDVPLTMDDYGFKVNYVLKFSPLAILKPQESAKLELKVYKNNEFIANVTESIIPRLISPAFKVNINYTNIENRKFRIIFNKKREKFIVETVEYSKQPIR